MRPRYRYEVRTERALRTALLLVFFIAAAVLFAAAVMGCSTALESAEPAPTGTTAASPDRHPSGSWSPGPPLSGGSSDPSDATDTRGATDGGLVGSPHAEPPDPPWLVEARGLIAAAIYAVRTQADRDALRKADGALVIDEVELALDYLRTVLAGNSAVPTVREAAIAVGREATRRRAGQ